MNVSAVLAAALVLLSAALVWAGGQVRLFVVEKDINPQNILVVYAQTDEQCRFEPIESGDGPHLYDFHWLMGGSRFKRTHPLIKKAARKRFAARDLSADGRAFSVVFKDLRELDHDLPSNSIRIQSFRTPQGHCTTRALLTLGERGGHRILVIRSIYSRAKKFLGAPTGVVYVDLRGVDARSGKPLTVRFYSR